MIVRRTGAWTTETGEIGAHALARHYDVAIVGARCAGAAVALLLARRGLKVLAIDRARHGSDTLSTHALMRGGTLQLHKWGLLPGLQHAGVPPIRSTSFFYGADEVRLPIKPKDGVDALYAPRRSVLDPMLADAAVSAGADVMHEAQVLQLLRRRSGRTVGLILEDRAGLQHRVAADLVVGADGWRSTIARLVGAQTYATGAHASGVVYGHWLGAPAGGYEWYFIPGASAGVIPTNPPAATAAVPAACIFVAVPSAQFAATFRASVAAGYHRLLSEISPSLAWKVARAQRLGNFHGFAGQPGFFRQSWGPGWALVGDAGYFKDPLTAHGITDALRDAELLADAIAAGREASFAAYQQQRDALARDVFDVTDRIASFGWDLDALRPMHEQLAAAMAKEVKAMTLRPAA
jgi:menaquinone-9 beta-reductase